MIKPINVEQQNETRRGIEEGSVTPTCTYCKKSPCYQLSYQGEQLVHTLLFDETRLICTECWSFMNKNGRWVTKLIRVLLRIDVLFRKKA